MFESQMIESQRPRGRRRRFVTLPLAIALHIAGLAGILLAHSWRVESLPAPPLHIRYNPGVDRKVQLGRPQSKAGDSALSAVEKRQRPSQPVQPAEPPPKDSSTRPLTNNDDSRIPLPAQDSGFGTPGSEAGGLGDEAGESFGAPGGDPFGTPGGDGPGAQDYVHTVGGAVTAPVLIHSVQPEYPEVLRRLRIEGVVVLEAIIEPDGSVRRLHGIRADHALFEAAAIAAVRQWLYRAATMHKEPVAVYLQVTIRFNLQ